jgi:toxin ParE1/3/4
VAIKYKLRQEAIEDLKEIGGYPLKNHGKNQRHIYLQGIKKRFESLADMPLMGRPRNEIKEGYYSRDYNKHIIFYLIQESYIEVLGVLHETMLPERHV